MSQAASFFNWGSLSKLAGNKSKQNIKNYRVNKEIKNASIYEPISIDYTKLDDKEYLQTLFNRMYNTITTYDNGSFYSALYGGEAHRMNIIDPADETYFQTVSDIPSLRPDGIFSFTYYKPTISFSSLIKQEGLSESDVGIAVRNYLSPGALEKNIRRIYLQGILKYLELTTETEFKNWKVTVYTDKYTINYFKNIRDQIIDNNVSKVEDVLEYYHWLKLYSHPNAIIMCVTMPSYSMNNVGEIVEYSIIRMTRFHAFQLFPDIPVFVRDADTLFTNKPTYLLFKNDIYTPGMPETDKAFLYNWEATFYKKLREKNGGLPFCIGVNDLYKKPWHFDPHVNKESLGIFAGFVSSLGDIDKWKDGTLWASCMKYIEDRFKMTPIIIPESIREKVTKTNKTKKVTNNFAKSYNINGSHYETYIGKDEQVLIFALLSQLLSKTYFYYLDVIKLDNSAVFRENSPLAREARDIKQKYSEILPSEEEITEIQKIQKIINIFDTPAIHDRLKYLFDRIITGGGRGTKRPMRNANNGNNGSQKRRAGGRRMRNKTVKRRA
jgi:hypothetical protein